MKILYVTTIGLTMMFFKSLVRELIEEVHQVDIATNDTESKVDPIYSEMGCRVFTVGFSRSPLKKDNFEAVKQLQKFVREEHYDIVHCHTPVAAFCARLACRKMRKHGLKVIYTAHGFHFYKGAPLKNWLIYYPAEWLCSFWTDTLITINHEDYARAQKRLHAKNVEYVPGVGVDIAEYADTIVDKARKRMEISVPADAFLLISVGELNRNKNHQVVIKALAQLKNPAIHYIIAGEGDLREKNIELAESLGVGSQVHFLGQRDDVAELYKISDVNVFPSIREGLGLAALEGMAAGLPLICSDNRGTREYAEQGKNSIVCSNIVDEYASAIDVLLNNPANRMKYGSNAAISSRRFDFHISNELMRKVYHDSD